MTDSSIKRGVSLYSYQEEYFLRKMSLEDCIAVTVEMGALGIETIAEQMMPGFPYLTEDFYRQWDAWVDKYQFTPTTHDMFAELKLYPDRDRPTQELVEDLYRDIDHTARLGGEKIVKILAATPPEVVERAAPHAAERGVRLLTEVHAPRRINSEWFNAHLEVAQRVGPEVVGFCPDLGIFAKRFPRVVWERALRDGADPDFVKRTVDVYDSGEDTAVLVDDAERLNLGQLEKYLAWSATRHIYEDPELLLEFMPFVQHIHAKFYEMTDEGEEYSIPYPEIIDVLQRGGFRGYLSSEYEGNRHIEDAYPVDSVDQVRRQQKMFARLLGE